MHVIDGARCADNDAAFRFGRGNSLEPGAQSFMKVAVETLEPVGAPRPQRGTREAGLNGEIEDQSLVGSEIADCELLQFSQLVERHTAAIALIGDRRIIEAIADHPASLSQRRPDQPRDVLASRRVKQQRFADGVPAFGFAFDQELADRLGARRASGFAGCLRGNPATLQRFDEKLYLGRFSSPLPAF